MTKEFQIIDDGNLRKYYIQIPNIIDDTEMSLAAFRLYIHLKRVAGDNGICWQSTQTLADACFMSTGVVSKVKKELIALKLITIQKEKNPKGGRDFHHIRIVDKWLENMKEYRSSSFNEVASSSNEFTSSPDELKNNSFKKELKDSSPLASETPEILKPKSEYVQNMEHLEKAFAEKRCVPEPNWSNGNPKELNKRWRSPLKRMFALCNGDLDKCVLVIKKVITKMVEDGLILDAPASIEKNFNSFIADLNLQQKGVNKPNYTRIRQEEERIKRQGQPT